MCHSMKEFPTDLGSILVRMGACTQRQVDAARRLDEERFGEGLVKARIISDDTLQEALRLQFSLQSTSEVPIADLACLLDHALARYAKNTRTMGSLLEGTLAKHAAG